VVGSGFQRWSLFTVALALFLSASSTATGHEKPTESQQPQQPAPTFRSRVDLIRVDITVRGRDDAILDDLKPADFEIEEDGVLQKVETLQFIRLDGTRSGNVEESLDIRSPEHAAVEAARDDVRLFAIFLDDYHVDKAPVITLPLRKTLKHLVDQFGPNDLITVMDPLTPLSSLKFTRSRDELLLRMSQFEGRRGQVFPVKSVLEEQQLAYRNIWEIRGNVTLSALSALVTHLGGLREGRKSVLFVSQGPPLGRPGSPNDDRLNEVIQAANRGNVTIHVLDPRPLGASPLGGADSLARLYNETGGLAIINTNDHASKVGKIVEDASAYYLLGYSPTHEIADGKYHRIRVRVKRRGADVTARQGYWSPTAKEMTPDEEPVATEPGMTEALTDLVEPKEGRVADVWLGSSRGPEGATRVTISWEPTDRTEAKNAARLLVAPVKPGETPSERDTQTIASVSAKDGAKIATFDLLPASAMTLRFTVQDAAGEVLDEWRQDLDVPNLGADPIALSTPRFLRAQSAFEMRALDRGSDPAPAATRRFRKTDRVLVDVECYADGQHATVTAQLLNGRGDRLTDLNPTVASDGRTRFTLPLSSVAPGTYVLRLQAHAGEHEIFQRSAFRVVP
jgi:VWFA-related protein